ncbi:MAG: ATP-binding protein [Rhodothermia bacterium]
MIRRNVTEFVLEALRDTPVVLVHGARQTGKSTLVRQIASNEHEAKYVTLDDLSMLSASQTDPDGFVQSFGGPAVIDEIQRSPDLFRAIKVAVDRDRAPGRFLLTGSADVLLLPNVSESLAGRMEIVTLWPFSQGEMSGRRERFVDSLFQKTLPMLPSSKSDGERDLWCRMISGGYPEAVARSATRRKRAWFSAYTTTILKRDVREIANIEHLAALPRLLSLLAGRTASLLNYSEISRALGMPLSTLKRYMTLLEMTFLTRTLPAWHSNVGKRIVKAPKLLLTDSGLAAHLLGTWEIDLDTDRTVLGRLLENFVAMEIIKQSSWSDLQPTLHHFRLETGREVDIVLESASGKLVGLEVKAASSVTSGDFKGLRTLAELQPTKFHRGAVMYNGDKIVQFGPNLHALPIRALWTY